MENTSDLAHGILVKFDEILSTEAFLAYEKENSQERWRDEVHRFHIWSKNVGIQPVSSFTVDQRLKHKPQLHFQITRLLRRLQELLEYLRDVLLEENGVETKETSFKVARTLPGLDNRTEMTHIYECFMETITCLNRLSYAIPKTTKCHTSMEIASVEVSNMLVEPDMEMISSKDKLQNFYVVLAGRVDKPTIFSTWAHVHPRVAGFVGGEYFKVNTLENAHRSIELRGITDFDEFLIHEGENIDKQGSRQAYYAVAFGRKTGIYNTWQYVYSHIKRISLIMCREARAEIEDWVFPCYERLDTIHEAERFIEDWNHAYADSWRWTVKNRLSNGWAASELGTDIESILFKIKLEVQSPYGPKRGLEKLEEEMKNQAIYSFKSGDFLGDYVKKGPQHIATLAATSELENTSEDFDDIDRQQNWLHAKFSQEVIRIRDEETVKDIQAQEEKGSVAATQRGPAAKKAEDEDALKNKIIEHFSQLTLDPDFKKASATYSQEAEDEDALKNKIIEHFSQLTLDPDFKIASATYSQVKEQQEQIRTRDQKLTSLQKVIKAQKERESVVISTFSAMNQDLTIQKETAEKIIVSLQKEITEKAKSLAEISRRIQELQRQLQTLLSERSHYERKMNSMIAEHNLEIDLFQTKLKERDASIDKLKEINAKLTSLLADEKAKSGHLE